MFRDDEEALKLRISALDEALLAERSRTRESAAEVKRLRELLASCRKELGDRRPLASVKRLGGRAVMVLCVAVLLAVLGTAAAASIGVSHRPGNDPGLRRGADGLLYVRSREGIGEVRVDGREAGYTPFYGFLPPGPHRVELKWIRPDTGDDAPRAISRSVVVEPARTTTVWIEPEDWK